MSNAQIPNLPVAIGLDGSEQLEIVQAGESKRTNVAEIALFADFNASNPPSLNLDTVLGYENGVFGKQSMGGLVFSPIGYTVQNGLDRLFVRGPLNLPDGFSFRSKNNTDTVSLGLEFAGSTIQITPSVGFRVRPTPNSLARGLDISQSGPSGSNAGPIFFNKLEGAYSSTITGDGPDGANPASINMFHASLGVGGPNFFAESAAAIGFGLVINADDPTSGDRLGFNGGIYTDKVSAARMYGGSTGATIAGTGSAAQLIGFETDVFLLDTATTDYRIGFNAWSGGTRHASVVDAAYAIGVHGGVGRIGWKTGIVLFTGDGGNPPITADGDFVSADAPLAMKNFFNLDGVTVTDYLLKSIYLNINAAGDVLMAPGAYLNWGSRSFINSPADGYISFQNSAQNAFTGLRLGPTGTTYNMLKHVSAGILGVKLTDDSAYSYLQARAFIANPTATGSLPVSPPEGAIFYDTTLNKLKFWNGAAYETVTSV